MTTTPLLKLVKLRREFPAGDSIVEVLKGIDLTIYDGEMVAIIGASGSGKSTLMNILGCLDRPTSGSYQVAGRETAEFRSDELAALRREHFGFVFQRYHLLADLTALANVEVPAIYAGRSVSARHARARSLLCRLGLPGHLEHKPAQLSGGQQQRVSIARALMNGGRVILADEPTGALDTTHGEEVMRILEELHAEGHTIIIVTHNVEVAARAQRIIEIGDGEILSDRESISGRSEGRSHSKSLQSAAGFAWGAMIEQFGDAFHMAVLAMRAHPLRTFLTMLGIIIGIASVVSVVALGKGAEEQVLTQISELGTNTIDIYPGESFGDVRAAAIQTLIAADASALSKQPYVHSATPSVSTHVTTRYRNIIAATQIVGAGASYFQVRGWQIVQGRGFDEEDVRHSEQVAVIDQKTLSTLFPDGRGVLGAVVLLGSMPARIVGVLGPQPSAGSSLTIYLPYTTVAVRMLGETHLESITVRIKDSVSSLVAQQAVTDFLIRRHRKKDFFIFNSDQLRQTILHTSATLTLLISAIAIISLAVGGIGVMNIMLVSVTERTSEIGVRMAIGARQTDILHQFLIEAVLICLLGGLIGVALAVALGQALSMSGYRMIFSFPAIALACVTSSIIGIAFGFLPARSAARLDPVEALARN